MPSSLVKSIEKLINTKVAAYNKLVSEKFDIDVKELEKLWNEASGTKEKKVSNFQKFCKEKRVELKESNPELKFGEVNKRLGEMWRGLSDEEKSSYN